MDAATIKAKCRKVYIHVSGNKIFDSGVGEYDFISAFREEKKAQDTLDFKQSTNYEYHKHRREPPQRVVGFYLVPIRCVDEDSRP